MKKFGKILIVIGILLLIVGFTAQIIVKNNENVKTIESLVGAELSPETVNRILDKVSSWGLMDLIGQNNQGTVTGLKVYAASPTLLWSGAAALVLGIVLTAVGKRG